MRGASEAGGGRSEATTLRRTDRLRKRFEFRHVQLRGRRIHTPHFVIVLQQNSLEKTRLGITVTKKVGNAVQRNRIKRLVREVFRRNRSLFPHGHDLVFIAKRQAQGLSYEAVLHEVRRCARKLDVAGSTP